MKWFKKKVKCLVCGRKVEEKTADKVQYSFVDEEGKKCMGEAPLCKKCGNKMNTTSEEFYDAL